MVAPKLRFKEFDGDWSRYKIAEVTEYLVDGTHFSPKTTEGEFKYITSKNIRNDGLDLTNISYISKDEHEKIYKRCKVQLGDILLTKDGANTGNCCLNTLDEEFSLLSSVAVLRGKKDSFNNNFILQILQSDLGQDTIISSMSGQAITRITLAKLKDYSFFFPELTEQTQITSFLSAVDEKISQLTQKHELLSQYKQGMMQKLFSQQIRFKADDGSEFGEWGKAKVGNITETIFGYPFDSKEMVEDTNGIPLMRGINIGECHIRHSFELDRFFLKDTSKLEKYFVRVNDIVLSMDGSKVGRNSAFVTEKDAGSLLVQRVCILREKANTNIQYVYQWIISKEFHRYVDQVKTSSGIPHISGKQIQDYEISYPCLEEQTKIANFLSAIDQKIEVVAQQIEQAKTWKKGLLQQMFV